jgi:hypothetical protein
MTSNQLVRSAVACIDSVMMYPQPPNSDEPCSTCGGKGYRRKCGCWRKQDGKGGDTEKKSAAEANSHEQAGISLLASNEKEVSSRHRERAVLEVKRF